MGIIFQHDLVIPRLSQTIVEFEQDKKPGEYLSISVSFYQSI